MMSIANITITLFIAIILTRQDMQQESTALRVASEQPTCYANVSFPFHRPPPTALLSAPLPFSASEAVCM